MAGQADSQAQRIGDPSTQREAPAHDVESRGARLIEPAVGLQIGRALRKQPVGGKGGGVPGQLMAVEGQRPGSERVDIGDEREPGEVVA